MIDHIQQYLEKQAERRRQSDERYERLLKAVYIRRAIENLETDLAWHERCSCDRRISNSFYYTSGVEKRDREHRDLLLRKIRSLSALID